MQLCFFYLPGTHLVLGKYCNRYLHSGMKSEGTQPGIQGAFIYTHQTGSCLSQPLGACSWSPQRTGRKETTPQGLFHTEGARWLLCPAQMHR